MRSVGVSEKRREPEPRTGEPLLRVEGLTVHFPLGGAWGRRRRVVHAVDDVSFEIRRGETLGLVGESGSGKTTTGRAILRRVPITAGRIWFKGRDITGLRGEELRRLRRDMQLVFQDPYASLNPRWRTNRIIAEPLKAHGLVSDRAEIASQQPPSGDRLAHAVRKKIEAEFEGQFIPLRTNFLAVLDAASGKPEKFIDLDMPRMVRAASGKLVYAVTSDGTAVAAVDVAELKHGPSASRPRGTPPAPARPAVPRPACHRPAPSRDAAR